MLSICAQKWSVNLNMREGHADTKRDRITNLKQMTYLSDLMRRIFQCRLYVLNTCCSNQAIHTIVPGSNIADYLVEILSILNINTAIVKGACRTIFWLVGEQHSEAGVLNAFFPWQIESGAKEDVPSNWLANLCLVSMNTSSGFSRRSRQYTRNC